ncbi:MAG: histidinol-phosphate transaminase [Chthoniobacterales bacterium]
MSVDLIRPDLVGMSTYVSSSTPGKIRLHINEVPWVRTEQLPVELNRYPDVEPQSNLEQELAKNYHVAPEELLLTRSADEGIDFVMRLFLRPGIDSIMQFPPAFLMYAFFARLHQASVISCSLEESDFRLNTELLRQLWQPHCKLIMLCSPNNPTGNLVDLETVATLCQEFAKRSIIVVDEAYVEFSKTVSATTLISSFDNLLVLRTLSKAHGLAGLRLGCVIGSAPLIKALRSIVPPFTFSSFVLETASRLLKNKSWVKRTVEDIVTFREALAAYLKNLSWVEKVYPSEANFILIKTKYAQAVHAWLEHHGILIRHFAGNPSMQDKLRITVGDATQNQALRTTLDSFSPHL